MEFRHFSVFAVNLGLPAAKKRKPKDSTFLRTAPFSKFADFFGFFEFFSQNVGILSIFVEICHFRSDFDENLLEFHKIF